MEKSKPDSSIDSANILTAAELAAKLKTPPTWPYSQLRSTCADQIPHFYVGRYPRFDWNEVCAWLKKRGRR